MLADFATKKNADNSIRINLQFFQVLNNNKNSKNQNLN